MPDRSPWTAACRVCAIVLALGGLTLLPARAQAPAAGALTPVRFSLDWRVEGPAAPFLVALDKGYFKEEGLDVTIDPAPNSREPITRVASGTHDMGFGDINFMIRFRDENPEAGIKAVMMVYDRPPFAIVGRKSRGITRDLTSLKDKRFGAPANDAAFAQWPIFRAVNKIDDKEWNLRFENVGFPVREPMLAQGEVDAVFGFAMSSAVNLKSRGVPPDDIVVLNMSDYGVDLYGNAILANEKFLKQNPEAVRGFLRAFVKGLKETIANPEEAVATVLARNDLARKEVELERLNMVLGQNILTPEVKANGFGGIDKARFAKAIEQIGLTHEYKTKPKPEDVFTDEFLPPAEARRLP